QMPVFHDDRFFGLLDFLERARLAFITTRSLTPMQKLIAFETTVQLSTMDGGICKFHAVTICVNDAEGVSNRIQGCL
ncbi:MAG: hypothetical protein P8074_06495, partial [Anaerolineales bacterium]